MRESVWSPKERQCLSLLRQRNTRASILQIHAFILRNALETNINLLTKFITTCSSLTTITYTRNVFDQIPNKDDAFLCNTVIKSHLVVNKFIECIGFYIHLRRNTGFAPDNYTFSWLAKSCALSSASSVGEQVHKDVIKLGFCSNLYASTSLVDMYAKFGRMKCARKVFDEMPDRSQVSWTALVCGYAKTGDMDTARNIFYQSPEKDSAAYNVMIDGYVKMGDMDTARNIFYQSPEKDSAAYNVMIDGYVKMGDMASARCLFDGMPERNVVSWTSMIDGYCTNGDVSEARLLFDAMPEKNLYSWNAMIGGYCQNKKPDEALKVFHKMQSSTFLEPDRVTIVSILPAIADLGALDLGEWVHRYVKKKKLDRETNVGTALVDMFAKCGEILKAKRVFDEMLEKEIATWNALIIGMAVNGRAREALEVFSEMRNSPFRPNEISMLGVLIACNHSGLVEEGKRWFKSMAELGLTPKIEHYGCMVDLLGRAGLLEEAEKLVECMPFQANGIILSSLLVACVNAKDVDRAERITKKAIKMDPQNDGNYVMMRNLYAKERRWRDVEEIKGMMSREGAKKEAGCSVIEIDSRVWEFVAGDKSHTHSAMIKGVLLDLSREMSGELLSKPQVF